MLGAAAALFGTQPDKLIDALDVLPRQTAALETLLALCGELLCRC